MSKLVLLALLLLPPVAFGQPNGERNGRFRIVGMTEAGPYSHQPTLLLDTSTGKTWRLCKGSEEPNSFMWCPICTEGEKGCHEGWRARATPAK